MVKLAVHLVQTEKTQKERGTMQKWFKHRQPCLVKQSPDRLQ